MSESEANMEGAWLGTDEDSKLAGNSDLWNDSNLEIYPEFGTSNFMGIPACYRSYNGGDYSYMGNSCEFWSSSEIGIGTYAWSET